MSSNELFKEMCIEDEIQYDHQNQEDPNIAMDSDELFKKMCIEDETQYDYQHQEGPNEDYFECEADYLSGNWCC